MLRTWVRQAQRDEGQRAGLTTDERERIKALYAEVVMHVLNAAGGLEGFVMSECIHCQIHDLLESHLQNQEINLADITFKVTEVLADLILMAPPEDQGMVIADILKNLGQFVLEKDGEAEDEGQPGRRKH
jgi:hypothetical protein